MHTHFIPFGNVPQFTRKDKAYTLQDPSLRPFYTYAPIAENIPSVIQDKASQDIDRKVLTEVLKDQYKDRNPSVEVARQIDLLGKDTTFTLVTAHQPNLFTGPLYYVYKIISVIRLCEFLNKQYPDSHFVPLFISGNEDHDFEEINHFELFGKRVTWQNEEKGAVGMMSLDSMSGPLEETQRILGDSPNGREMFSLLENAYTGTHSYGEAAIRLTHALFGNQGLVILNTSDHRLKRQFIPSMKREIFEQPSRALIEKTGQQLETLGYELQAFPREINFFYMTNQLRSRIVREGHIFRVLDSELTFSETELEQEIDSHPERFSPNVVMRPIYQESILPNLAYIGGGGELAYWLERKAQFEAFGLNFPMLIRRHSALWIDAGSSKKLAKVGLKVEDLLIDSEDTIKAYVRSHADHQLTLGKQRAAVAEIFKEISEIARQVDPTLVGKVKAELAGQINTLSQLEGRLIKAEKAKHDTAVQQIRSLYDKLFPNRGLQERSANFMELFVRHGWNAIDILKNHFEPFSTDFVVIQE